MKTQEQSISDINMIKTLLTDTTARLKEAKKLSEGFEYDATMHQTRELLDGVINMVSSQLIILNYYYKQDK